MGNPDSNVLSWHSIGENRGDTKEKKCPKIHIASTKMLPRIPSRNLQLICQNLESHHQKINLAYTNHCINISSIREGKRMTSEEGIDQKFWLEWLQMNGNLNLPNNLLLNWKYDYFLGLRVSFLSASVSWRNSIIILTTNLGSYNFLAASNIKGQRFNYAQFNYHHIMREQKLQMSLYLGLKFLCILLWTSQQLMNLCLH